MPVAEQQLPIREEALRCDQVQRVLGPRHGDIEEPTLLLDLSRRAGAEMDGMQPSTTLSTKTDLHS